MAGIAKRVTVVVADDHPVVRLGIVRALTSSGRVEVVAEAADGRAALEAVREHRPAVALLDYRMPGLDGVAVAHAVSCDGLPTRVLLLSAFDDSHLVSTALDQGAAGFLTKDADSDEIVNAVLACARGGEDADGGAQPALAT
ncbi:hypothetical protein Mkiyose1665_56850 [Mycobacterium kiyosense]|uniref:Response regulatory domain-containing protein n=1 Tax=Mycobacterium kiyosense TaxID=2871094 RepID=A0A9P3QEU2_9MYCO|nr:hypothetical protein SRL2020028_59290 [Mycobacterium kiyosense]GLB96608.1 hypothetical protein SRL2020226_33840 [Mycobacterium kiyosense]GLD33742.1 hypothetical protein Mkiyose1413_56250 [Mycobacterium kiyosense]GLD36988.1 hypothetical protein Mkiyose1595_32080 [Mycobacterium kiyosense]GLD45185.1 hypothetical protein Mkiyose1665_56850 [Mycobacterium kiyosense]